MRRLLHLVDAEGPQRLLPRARIRYLVGESGSFRPSRLEASLFNKDPRLGIAA
jgi:hypothetical protein